MSTPCKMSNLTIKNSDRILDDLAMRAVFEEHLPWLLENAELHQVDPTNAYRFHHDLSAYLQNINIDVRYHWLYMRLNNYRYNWEFTENTEYLYFPKLENIDTLISAYVIIS